MTTAQKIEIKYSKLKLIFTFILSFSILAPIPFVLLSPVENSFEGMDFLSFAILILIGVYGIFRVVLGAIKLLRNKPEVIIDENGIFTGKDTIPWNDIIRFDDKWFYMVIVTKNPKEYLKNSSNWFTRYQKNKFYRRTGSATYIPCFYINRMELKRALRSDFVKSKIDVT